MDTAPIVISSVGVFTQNALLVLVSIFGVIVGLVLFQSALHWFRDAALDRMHSEWGTRTFRRLGETGQRAWSYFDRRASRARIMEMDV